MQVFAGFVILAGDLLGRLSAGLALAGFLPYIKPGRIQILGESELNYLDTMPIDVRSERIASICALPVAAFVVTKGQTPPDDIVRECRLRKIPLLVSDRTTSVVIQSITSVLEDELAPTTTLHGVLVDVYGMGLLLLGESGIGKSECALDLVHRGHRLVADDAVEIRRYPNGALVGRAAEMIRYHMELRGIGIINIKHLFGVSAVRASKSVEVVIELQRWDPAKKYDRLGIDGESYTILERERPLLRLPVASGRNLALLIESPRATAAEVAGLRRCQGVRPESRRGDRPQRAAGGRRPVSAAPESVRAGVPESLVVATGLSGSERATSTSASRTWVLLRGQPAPGAARPLIAQVSTGNGGHHPGRPQPRLRDPVSRDPGPLASRVPGTRCCSWTPRRISDPAVFGTRRPHPLAGKSSLLEALRRERAMLENVRAVADVVVDTSA